MNYFDFLFRISVCFILGILIGLERQFRRKTAGIRTITLVSLGAFLFVSISNLTDANDITRIAAQVVSGIGFIGAGVILRDGTNIRGLNTAATLWCSAAIGALCALGLIAEAAVGVAYILMANLFLRSISRKLLKKTIQSKVTNYILTISCKEDKEATIRSSLIQKLKSNQISIKGLSTKTVHNQVQLEIKLEISSAFSDDIDNIINKLCTDPNITYISYNEVANYIEDDDDDYVSEDK